MDQEDDECGHHDPEADQKVYASYSGQQVVEVGEAFSAVVEVVD